MSLSFKISSITVFVTSLLIVETYCGARLPSWFKLGAGTSASQAEGGWNASDRGESVFDRFYHQYPESPLDVTCDSYHLWRRDIEMAAELGLDIYRFSISWTRLLPTGFPNYISEDGKNYYNNLINGLLEKGIEPCITLYHFDLPQNLQDLGGWTNPLISDWFADYARVAFSLYGDRVKTWLTINEPFVICDMGYTNKFVPFLYDFTAQYICNKYVLIAHAKVYRLYEKEFKPLYNGKVSIVTLFVWMQAATPDDEKVTDLTIELMTLRFCHPIYSKEGGWPKKLETILLEKSQRDGQPTHILPPFTPEEIKLVQGTYDFFALNHYTSRLVRKARPGEVIGSIATAEGSEILGVVMESDPKWEKTHDSWFSVNPEGLRKVLNWLKTNYDINEVLITENGYRSNDTSLADYKTVNYTKRYMEQVILAIQDGVNVTGYINWSLMDVFEGSYDVKFGLYFVDYNDTNRTRTIRESGRYFSRLSRTRCTDPDECETL